jgi:hypothetical protein
MGLAVSLVEGLSQQPYVVRAHLEHEVGQRRAPI